MIQDARVIAIPLGDADRGVVQGAIAARFPSARVDWLDRSELRRRPWRVLPRLAVRRYTDAVLVAPDLGLQRLELTSLLLGLPRASQRWRIDLRGQAQGFHTSDHLRRVLPRLVRHLSACGIALLFAYPALKLIDALIRERPMPPVKDPKRVLYLRSLLWLGLEGGGSVAHTAGVIGGLQQAGVEVHVVSSDRLPGVAAPTSLRPPIVWFDGRLREAEDLAYNAAFFNSARVAAQKWRPHVLYQRHTAFNCVGALLSRLLGIPLVLEFNSSEVWKGQHWGGLHHPRLAALVERINLRAADRVVVVSEPLRQQVLTSGAAPHKLLVNPNAVEPDRFLPEHGATALRRRFGLQSTVVIGFTGTFGVWHGVPTLAASMRQVLACRPHVRFLLVGDGPLKKLVDQVERACLPGMVPHAHIPDYLAACDILVSPHGRQVDGGEFFGSPTKLFEYMAAGRPIVASAVGQIAEVLEDEQTAVLVEPDDPDGLTRAIVRLVDDAALRAKLGQRARHLVLSQHTWRHNAQRLLGSLRPT